MWIFGENGLDIYQVDGSRHVKHTPGDEICHNVTGYRGGGTELACNFYDVVSDGKKYVWGAVSRGVAKIDVFDIDTGSTVGSFETCNSPRDLGYNSLRDEVWVRCAAPHHDENGADLGEDTFMDVFSASAPGAATESDVQLDLPGNNTYGLGFSIVDNSLGDVGYTTVWSDNNLYKIDLSAKTVLDKFEIPLAYGLYRAGYSQVNNHVFMRATVCCTCGFDGASKESCGRYGSELITPTTGPFA